MTQATRVEVVDAVEGCFASGPPTRDDLIQQALSVGAHSGVIEVLKRLPDRRINEVRQIWELVPGVPLDR